MITIEVMLITIEVILITIEVILITIEVMLMIFDFIFDNKIVFSNKITQYFYVFISR